MQKTFIGFDQTQCSCKERVKILEDSLGSFKVWKNNVSNELIKQTQQINKLEGRIQELDDIISAPSGIRSEILFKESEKIIQNT